jgi:hypothetical protein
MVMRSEAEMLTYSKWHELLTNHENAMGAEERYTSCSTWLTNIAAEKSSARQSESP